MSRLTISAADRLETVAVEGLRFQRRFRIVHRPGMLSPAGVHLVQAFREAVGALVGADGPRTTARMP